MAGFSRGGRRSSRSGGCDLSKDRVIDPTTFTSTQLIENMRSQNVSLPSVGWIPLTTSILAPTSPTVIWHSATPQNSIARQV